jgi:uncharacterized membrane protein
MVQGHTLAVLLAPSYADGAVFKGWLYMRGLTSCAFLLLSGFSFGLATDRHWDEYGAWTPRLRRRLVRFGIFLLLGYAMRIPVRPLSRFSELSAGQWQAFGAVDILQLVAVTLLALQAGAWVLRTRARLAAGAAVAAGVLVLLTPPAWSVDWSRVLPVFLASYLSPATGSLFPLLPWAAYILLGAALGLAFVLWRERRPEGGVGRVFLVAGAGMIVTGVAAYLSPFAPYGAIDFWKSSPNLFLVKAGSVLVLLAGAVRVTRAARALPYGITVLSRESLVVYFIHLCVLYGSIWNDGLFQVIGPRLGPAATTGWVVLMLGSMSLLAWVWHECKDRSWHTSAFIRAAVTVAAIYAIA